MKEAAQETVKERLKSPFVGAFILAFLASHWKVLLISGSELKIDEKIAQIQPMLADLSIAGRALIIAAAYALLGKALNGVVEVVHARWDKIFGDVIFKINSSRLDSQARLEKTEKIGRASRILAVLACQADSDKGEIIKILKQKGRLEEFADAVDNRASSYLNLPPNMYKTVNELIDGRNKYEWLDEDLSQD